MLIPKHSAAKKIKVSAIPNARAVTAGPGQTPPSPQPRPNKTEPRTSGISIDLFVGNESFVSQRGFPLLMIKGKLNNVTDNAPIITNSNRGSHWPVTSKKPTTTAGLIICDKHNPNPKIAPTTSALKDCLPTRHLQINGSDKLLKNLQT